MMDKNTVSLVEAFTKERKQSYGTAVTKYEYQQPKETSESAKQSVPTACLNDQEFVRLVTDSFLSQLHQ